MSMRPIRIGSAMRIEIGYDGENGAREIVFDATQWMKEMPGCTAAITAERADGEKYIAPDVTQDEGKKTITWTLTSAETMEGEGRAQLLWMDGERIAKQAIFTTVCHESLKSDATQIGVPEPVWAQKSVAAAQEAKESAQAAAASAEGAQNALAETKNVRDTAKQEIDGKKETAIAGIENEKTKAIAHIDAEKEELAPPIISTAEGVASVAADSADAPLRGLTVYGKTTQDGTPTEDAPVVLTGAGSASPLRIVTAGKNLAALTPRTTENLGITSSYDAQTGVLTVTGTATKMAFVSYWLREFIPAGVPLVIGMGNESSDGNIAIRTQSASESANTTIATLDSENKVVKVTLKHALEFIVIRVNEGATVNMKLRIGVTVGNSVTGYAWTHPDEPTGAQIAMPVWHTAVGGLMQGVPAQGSDATYTDEDGQGWIADTVEYDAQTGTAQIVRRVASVTYDGNASESWVKGGSNSYFAIRNADKSSASHGLCTHYQGLAINEGESKVGFTAATDASDIRFRPEGYADMTVDAWRAQLNASPVTVIYALAVPEITPITGDELAALTALRSRYPATTVFNNALAKMAVRYIANTKIYVDQANAEMASGILDVDKRIDTAMEQITGVGERADAARKKADENEIKIGELNDELDDIEKIVGLENITDNFDWDWQSGYISSGGLYSPSANFKRSNVSYFLEKNDVIAVKTKGYQTKISIISTVESVITPAVISLDSDVHLYIYRANCHKGVRLSVSVSDYKILLYKANPTSLFGKTVLNYGDSIAYGAGNSGEGYADILAGKYGMTVIDRSASGATMRTGVDGRSWISGRVINDVTNNYTPDIVLLEGGFNDVYNQSGDWIGALSDGYDVSSLVTTNLYGALEKSLNAVKTYYPAAKALFVITPKIKTSFYPVWDGAANDKFNTVRKAIIECCEKWSVEYVDLFTVSDFNSALSKYLEYTKDSDGVHPTREGYELFYVPYIERRLVSIKDGLK